MKPVNSLMKVMAVLVAAGVDGYALDRAAEERRMASKRIVISIPDRKLILLDGDRIQKIYSVAVGKPTTPSPQGEFRIVNHIPNPTWYGPAGKVVGPGPSNPIGTRWMGLSANGYGIHGTNEPRSIGKAASHGCIRMAKDDLEELFTLVDIGVPVTLSGTRAPEAAGILLTETFPALFLN
jgi:lipoprotein-anchoring transpeptidase ErfK/SrfK